jgi:hypothetical protein
MTSFLKNNLALVSQGITGHRIWDYTDSGVIGDINEVSGYVSLAGDMGMAAGDFVYVHATNKGLTEAVYGGVISSIEGVTDTGATQGTMGLTILIADTS